MSYVVLGFSSSSLHFERSKYFWHTWNTFVSKKNYKTVHSSVFHKHQSFILCCFWHSTWHLALNVFLSVLGASCQHSTWHLVFHKVQRARWEVLCQQLSLSTCLEIWWFFEIFSFLGFFCLFELSLMKYFHQQNVSDGSKMYFQFKGKMKNTLKRTTSWWAGRWEGGGVGSERDVGHRT